MLSPDQRVVNILIVEDNPADVYITKMALAKELRFESVVVDDGEPAIAYLKAESPFENAARPDLVLLDLNLKKVDGLEVLRWIRTTADWNRLPVIVLSSSPADARREAAAQATCYLQKPVTLEEYLTVGKAIRECLERSEQAIAPE
jgi:CheY-like chemotaxis protein